MAWGCISSFGRGCLTILPKNETVNSEKYIKVLQQKLKIFMNVHGCTYFMQDSAPCHVSKKTRNWLRSQKVRTIDWPGNSPDLNPIENIWRCMKHKVAFRYPSNLADLQHAIRQVWAFEITDELCRKCTESMPRRLQAVIANKGGITKY